MYFDAKTLLQILSDETAAATAAEAIADTRRRFTSPLAVAEVILALGPDGASAGQQVLSYLDSAGIEIRDMPPSHRLIEAATQPSAAGLDAATVLNHACADYYEAEVFSLPAATQTAPTEAASAQAAEAKPAGQPGTADG